jgi:hypothetical protein
MPLHAVAGEGAGSGVAARRPNLRDARLSTRFHKQPKILLGARRRFAILDERESLGPQAGLSGRRVPRPMEQHPIRQTFS